MRRKRRKSGIRRSSSTIRTAVLLLSIWTIICCGYCCYGYDMMVRRRMTWRLCGQPKRSLLHDTVEYIPPSPVERHKIFNREIYVKRDDLNALPGLPTVNGNKSRKLLTLSSLTPFPKVVVSYGGVQSNAMRALSLLCHAKSSKFVYITRNLPKWLKMNPSGNYMTAIETGTEVC